MLNKVLDVKKSDLINLAFQTKSSLRIPDKLFADGILEAFCMCSVHDECSLNNICVYLFDTFDLDISKQALVKRINREGTVELFKEVLKGFMLKSINNRNDYPSLKDKIDRVLIQDSTIIQLPNRLYKAFHGIVNAKSTKTLMRIQAVYDILNNNFVMFSLNSYKENDLASAPKIDVHDKDLWLRDRGYFTLGSCKKITEEGGNFILRYKTYTNLFREEKDANGKNIKLDLVKILKKNKRIKMKVFVGKKMVPMHLIAERVSDKIASERRRKANSKYRYEKDISSKEDQVTKKSMTKEYSFLCGYTIFLVSINADLEFEEVFALYALRWRIEVIFKSWKSHLNFKKIHNASANQLYVIIYSKLIMCNVAFSKFYNPFLTPVLEASEKYLSIIALTKHLAQDFKYNLELLNAGKTNILIEKFAKFCTYCKRKRKNYLEMEDDIFDILDQLYAN